MSDLDKYEREVFINTHKLHPIDNRNNELKIEEQHTAPETVYDVVDFFAGCGGMSYGFHAVGRHTGAFKHVAAFDNDRHANRTYATNLGHTPSDIDLATAEVSEIEAILDTKGRDRKAPLIVIGCAPCQGFSAHRKKDPRLDSRNSLVSKFAEIAVGLNASFVIMENVPDLLAEKHRHHFDLFVGTLKAAGYNITTGVVNMAEFGVPQERFRTLVLASRDFVPTLPAPAFDRIAFRTVRDAIGHLPALTAGQSCLKDPMHMTSKHKPETVDIIRQVPKDGGSRPIGVGPKCLDNVKGFYDVYGRLRWSKPAITITARCRTPSCGRFTHPEQDRGLSVREAGLLQGFPEDFVFEGPFDDKFKQIGNAVPPIFSEYLAGHILAMLTDSSKSSLESSASDQKPSRSCSSVIKHAKRPLRRAAVPAE